MIIVTCAIIRNEDDKVLVVQRNSSSDHPFKWEFPGGKLHKEETEEECIIREIKEELSIDLVLCGHLEEVIHDYGYKKIKLIPFICDTLDQIPVLMEHLAMQWIEPSKLLTVDLCEADVFVAEEYLDNIRKEISNSVVSEIANNKLEDDDIRVMFNTMLSMKEAELLAGSALENPAVLNKLLEYSLSDDHKLAFRASWTLTKVCDKYPELIYPNLDKYIDILRNVYNESVLRAVLRIISVCDLTKLDEERHGLLTEFCFNKLISGLSAIAVKVYSMEVLYRLTLIYPELANELSESIKMVMEEGAAAIQSRGRTILKKLSGNQLNSHI